MSCLILEDFPISNQIAIELSRAAYLCALASDVIDQLGPTDASLRSHPLDRPCPVVGSNSSLTAEHTAMADRQVQEHPPLQVCFPGHHAHMWESQADRKTMFYVECSACEVRTEKLATPDAAAHDWALRKVVPTVIAQVA